MGTQGEQTRPRNDELVPAYRAILEGIEQQAGTLQKIGMTSDDENAKIVKADAAAGVRVLCRAMAKSELPLAERVDLIRRLCATFRLLNEVDQGLAYPLRKLIEHLQARSYRDVICEGCRQGQAGPHTCHGADKSGHRCQCVLCFQSGVSSGK